MHEGTHSEQRFFVKQPLDEYFFQNRVLTFKKRSLFVGLCIRTSSSLYAQPKPVRRNPAAAVCCALEAR